MILRQVTHDDLGSASYLLGDDEAGVAAVVDPRLRVRGVSNLWVVDCSIMPTLVSGNTNVPAMMIAEKAADLVFADLRGA